MLKTLCQSIWGEFSLTRVHEDAQALYATDRWDTFDKFTETSLFLQAAMTKIGLDGVQRIAVATGGPVGDGSWRVKHTWQVNRATLTILEPSVDPHLKVLADYQQEPLSLVMFSDSTPAGGVEAEVVLYPSESLWPDKGSSAQSQSDLGGKLVLTHQGIRERWVDVVEKGGLASPLHQALLWLLPVPGTRRFPSSPPRPRPSCRKGWCGHQPGSRKILHRHSDNSRRRLGRARDMGRGPPLRARNVRQ